MFLLDTNILSEIRRSDRAEPKVLRWFEPLEPSDLFTSVMVLSEIERGVLKLKKRDLPRAKNLSLWLTALVSMFEDRVIPIDLVIALKYAEIQSNRTLPVVDGLLAASALERDLILVTRNVSDIAGTGVRYLNPFESRRVRRA